MQELYIKLDNFVKVSLFIFKLNYMVQCIYGNLITLGPSDLVRLFAFWSLDNFLG